MSAPSVLTNVGASSSWFDAFRDNGGPVLYSSMNRTPAIEDIRNILIYISFSTLFVAFLIIFPGIRKEVGSAFHSFIHSDVTKILVVVSGGFKKRSETQFVSVSLRFTSFCLFFFFFWLLLGLSRPLCMQLQLHFWFFCSVQFCLW